MSRSALTPPDVFVENTPEDELAGYDRELEAAVGGRMSGVMIPGS